jgi:HEAT repeat protein
MTPIQQLQDPSPRVRAEAARLLGKQKADQAVLPLIAALEDVDSHVRATVAWALAEIGNQLGVEPLRRTYAFYQQSVSKHYREMKQVDAYLNALVKLMGSEDLLLWLQTGTPHERSAAAIGLGNKKWKNAIPMLRKCLADEDADVRQSAAWALQVIGAGKDPDIPTPLIT